MGILMLIESMKEKFYMDNNLIDPISSKITVSKAKIDATAAIIVGRIFSNIYEQHKNGGNPKREKQ